MVRNPISGQLIPNLALRKLVALDIPTFDLYKQMQKAVLIQQRHPKGERE